MCGIDSPCHAVMGHLRNLRHLRFAEPGIRGDHADRRVLAWRTGLTYTASGSISLDDIYKAFTVRGSGTGNDLARLRIHHIPDTVHRKNRSDDNPVRQPDTGC